VPAAVARDLAAFERRPPGQGQIGPGPGQAARRLLALGNMSHLRCALERLDHRAACRVLVVCAHPDDEAVGLAATLARLHRTGAVLQILHVTDGAPRNPDLRPTLRQFTPAEAAAVRHEESRASLLAGGIDRAVLAESLAVADQEAAEAMAWTARALARRLAASEVDVVITHPYEGGHPDHDASALAVAAAIALVDRDGHAPPLHAEMSSYFLGDGALRTATFLPSPRSPCGGRLGILREDDRALRRRMLDAFASQRDVLAELRSEAEPFRCAPAYDFSRRPHEGTLNYERLAFGWTWARWRALADDALRDLGVTEHEALASAQRTARSPDRTPSRWGSRSR
jgi:LmbE family N-acetylglucosaminyl deacetylase